MRCHMNPDKMVGMSFDGTSSMKILPNLSKVKLHHKHYMCTALLIATNLSLKILRQFHHMIACAQDLCEDLYVFVGISPKRVLIFKDIQKQFDEDASLTRLKIMSKPR